MRLSLRGKEVMEELVKKERDHTARVRKYTYVCIYMCVCVRVIKICIYIYIFFEVLL